MPCDDPHDNPDSHPGEGLPGANVVLPRAGVSLRRGKEATTAIASLAKSSGTRVGLNGLLPHLDRPLRRSRWRRLLGRAVHSAWRFPAGEQRDLRWWPQGVATAPELWQSTDHELLIMSWYARVIDGENHGARLSVLDLASGRMGHVLLVHPDPAPDGALRPVLAHAGGVVWVGNTVHVAATGRGFHSFDVRDIIRLHDHSRVTALGYEYVLPMRRSWTAATEAGEEKLRYSFLSVDVSGEPPALMVGEYGRKAQSTRVASFPIDLASGDLAPVARPLTVQPTGIRGMQGLARVRGILYITVSHSTLRPGSLVVGRPGTFRRTRWALPMGPEDLCYRAVDDSLWTVTEHPRRRWLVRIDRAWVDRRMLGRAARAPIDS